MLLMEAVALTNDHIAREPVAEQTKLRALYLFKADIIKYVGSAVLSMST
jgi:hypothetical protein